jgi:hypothetical protein
MTSMALWGMGETAAIPPRLSAKKELVQQMITQAKQTKTAKTAEEE